MAAMPRIELSKYEVKGLSDRKRSLLNCGGNLLDMAIAMLEIETMNVNDYPFGDVDRWRKPKVKDAANFGIFKQGWFMIRSSVKRYQQFGPNDWQKNGMQINSNLRLDVEVLHESQKYYGSKWFLGHRQGQTGFTNPDKVDLDNYYNAVLLIQQNIGKDSKYQTDDTRFSVYVPPI